MTILVACQASRPASSTQASSPASSLSPAGTPPSSTSASPASGVSTGPPPSKPSSPSNVAIQNAICAAVFHGAPVSGGQCRATNVKVSTADGSWVYAHEGIYNAQGQLASDNDQVLLNLTTHELIGPTNVGFCPGAIGGGTVIYGYASVPAVVLASLGLSPCSPPAATASSPPASTPTTSGAAISVAALAGTWGAHQMLLVITSAGLGHLRYQDLTKCPSCSLGTAPAGTLDFTLRSVTNGVAAGRVTSSSDLKNWTLGLPVQVTLAAGSPGQLLKLTIGGKQLVDFCNGTSAGQCGA